MRILVTGATGFVGHALVMRLLGAGHQVIAVSRSAGRARERLGAGPEVASLPDSASGFADLVSGCDAVVNLAGESVVSGRWTRKRKRALRTSRVTLTENLVAGMSRAKNPPRVLISASAIGIYGDRGSETVSEDSDLAGDFLANLCRDWEAAALAAREHGARVTCLRIGIVLGRYGGAVDKLLPIFTAGLGGRLGSGKQFMSWIHLDDLVDLMLAALTDSRFSGPINAVSPSPVDNRQFSAALAAAVGSKSRFPVPAVALKLRFGQAAQPLLASQRVVPSRLQDLQHHFRHPQLRSALDELCAEDPTISVGSADEIGELPGSRYLESRRPRYRLAQRTVIPAPIDQVFEFFSKAENLGAITPPDMAFAIKTPTPISMKSDQTIDYTIRLGPVPMRWRTVIETWEPGRRFVDSQAKGPYRCWWHEHRFIPDGESTIMEDQVLYKPPLGPLGWLANRLLIGRMLRRIFTYRSYVIAQRFGQSAASMAKAA
jgi:uncharacterized protein (TIGR01777 family)